MFQLFILCTCTDMYHKLCCTGMVLQKAGDFFSAKLFTVVPGNQKVFAKFVPRSLMMESQMISIVGAGDSAAGVSA